MKIGFYYTKKSYVKPALNLFIIKKYFWIMIKQKILIDLSVNQYFSPSFKKKRAQIFVDRIAPYLKGCSKIIDIGCGDGYISYILTQNSKEVVPVDIHNITDKSLKLNITEYDGQTLPFTHKQFDCALLLMVLHHVENPMKLVDEVARICKRILVIEDIHSGMISGLYKLIDGLQNSPPIPIWQSYKSENEWIKLFREKRYKIQSKKRYRDFPIAHALFVLETKS